MPREVLVLLAIFLLLPLLQQLLVSARGRSRRFAEPVDKRQLPGTQPPPLAPVPPDPMPASVPDMSVAPEFNSTLTRISAPACLARPGAPPVARQRMTQRHSSSGTHERRLGLQHAIRLIAILGPCRANCSYDGLESTERR